MSVVLFFAQGSSAVKRQPHKLEVAGSTPAPAPIPIRDETAERQLAEARRDVERLDWLETSTQKIQHLAFGPTIDGERWVLTNKENFFGRTMREAIDAARAGNEQR